MGHRGVAGGRRSACKTADMAFKVRFSGWGAPEDYGDDGFEFLEGGVLAVHFDDAAKWSEYHPPAKWDQVLAEPHHLPGLNTPYVDEVDEEFADEDYADEDHEDEGYGDEGDEIHDDEGETEPEPSSAAPSWDSPPPRVTKVMSSLGSDADGPTLTTPQRAQWSSPASGTDS